MGKDNSMKNESIIFGLIPAGNGFLEPTLHSLNRKHRPKGNQITNVIYNIIRKILTRYRIKKIIRKILSQY